MPDTDAFEYARTIEQKFDEHRRTYAGLHQVLVDRIRANLDQARRVPDMRWYYVATARMQSRWLLSDRRRLIELCPPSRDLPPVPRIPLRNRAPDPLAPFVIALAPLPPKVIDPPRMAPPSIDLASIAVMSVSPEEAERRKAAAAEIMAARSLDQASLF